MCVNFSTFAADFCANWRLQNSEMRRFYSVYEVPYNNDNDDDFYLHSCGQKPDSGINS